MPSSVLRRLSLAVLLVCACGSPPAGEVKLEVGDKVVMLTGAQLAELPATTVEYKDHKYAGPRLREVLAAHQVATDRPLMASGADGYTKELSPETLVRDDAIVAHTSDGAPLRPEEGPLRLVIPNSPGLAIKQLVRLGRP